MPPLLKSLLCALLAGAVTFGCEGQLLFQNSTLLTAADGLSETHLNCLLEDADGFIWAGSKNGLNRYDGRTFRHFFSGDGPGQMKGQNIKCLASYDSLHILVGTDGGIARIHIRNFRIEPLVFPAPAQLAARTNNVHQLKVMAEGSCWAVTTGGVFLVSKDLVVLQAYYFPPEKVLTASHLQPNRIWVFPDGRLWAVGPLATQFDRQEVYEIRPENRSMSLLERQPFPDATRFLSLVQANDTLGFVLYEHSGGVRSGLFDLRRCNWVDVPCEPFKFEYFMPFFSQPGPGKIGFSTKGLDSFYSLDVAAGRWEYFPLPGPYILQGVVKSASGIIMAATSKGLLRTSPVNRLFDYWPTVEDAASTADGNGLRMTGMTCSDGRCKAVSWGGRLVVFDEKTGGIQASSDLRHPQCGKANIFSILPFEKDEMLAATNKGVFLVNGADGTSSLLPGKNKPSFFDSLTAFPFADSRGDIWFGFVQFRGLVKYSPREKAFTHYPFYSGKYSHLYFNEISSITEDLHGDIWFGWEGGGLGKWVRSADTIATFYPDLNVDHSFKNNITSMATAPDGRLWLGTAGYGIFAFHPDSMLFANYTSRDGLTHDYVTSLAVGCNGEIWVGTRNGLSRLDPRTGKIHRFYEQHGIPSNHIYTVKPMTDDPCRVFIGSEGGYRILDTRYFPDAPSSGAGIVVHSLKINGKDRPFLPDEKLVLEYDENNIEIAFSSLNLMDGYLDEFYYHYSEKDEIWKPVGPENILRLTGMQGGQYDVTIRTCSNGGYCFEQQILQFSIKKPFWKSPLYYGILGLIIAAITAVYFKIKLNNIERLQKLRQKISYDLHDDIGSNLSSIQVLTSLSKNPAVPPEKKAEIADKIKEAAGQVNQSLEEIIWSLHPGNDPFENTRSRLYEQAREVLEAKGITLHFNMEAEFDDLKLGHEKRRELLLLYREALNNIVKYAACQQVWVNFERKGQRLLLSIRDDGQGFNPATSTNGNGLTSMQFRAANLGGSLSIESKPGAGAYVLVEFTAG
ncbi:MAG: hypothetical protein H6577_27115 [Lewinellaceae bacterium]|nr:hypothetical protein [Saprospiraceae bacterium]MCB9341814.1 hypothetical protein [Lewinellaceae bacterium]